MYYDAVVILCSRFIWIANSSDLRSLFWEEISVCATVHTSMLWTCAIHNSFTSYEGDVSTLVFLRNHIIFNSFLLVV